MVYSKVLSDKNISNKDSNDCIIIENEIYSFADCNEMLCDCINDIEFIRSVL